MIVNFAQRQNDGAAGLHVKQWRAVRGSGRRTARRPSGRTGDARASQNKRWETQVVQGAWEHEGATFRDNLTRFFVDVPDLPEHRAFFKEFKQTLKLRFQQVEVWITSHEVDVI